MGMQNPSMISKGKMTVSIIPWEEIKRVIDTHTVASYFWEKVQERGDQIALREKDFGIWKSITWKQYGERAKWAGLGLVALGLQRGDAISITSECNPEWLYADIGCQGVGGVTNGIYTTDSAKQVEYIVNDSNSKFYIAENDEQLDKILDVRARTPQMKKIIVIDMEGLHDFNDPMVMSFDDLLKVGQEFEKKNPGYWEAELKKGKPSDLAILIYTSGTTGPSKGAMISHRNIMFQVMNTLLVPPERSNQLSFLPLCHIAERGFTVFNPLRVNTIVNFAESPETVAENLREVAPGLFFSVPRLWEKFYSGIAIQMKEATWFGKWAYSMAIGVGLKRAEHMVAGTPVPMSLAIGFWLADQLVLRNIKRMIGIGNCVFTATGAAPISPDLIRWYMALGVNMLEVYGQTENTGLATAPPASGDIKLGRVGVASPNTEVKISPEGEILLRGPHVFMGYLNQPEKTAETIDKDGWLHTGDVGEIDNQGWVKITDRMKDIIITAGGKNITPSEIENQLKFSPYVSDAVVIGDKRKFLTCLIMIDHDNVVKFAQDMNVPFTNFASLTRAKEVQDLIWQEIEKVNRNFARVETIKKFRLIDQMLTAEDDELTPTLKLKRKFVNQKYKDLIDSMYSGE